MRRMVLLHAMEPTQNISLRVPVALLAQLDVAAHEENRTRTQEIVLRLRRSVEREEGGSDE